MDLFGLLKTQNIRALTPGIILSLAHYLMQDHSTNILFKTLIYECFPDTRLSLFLRLVL